MKIEFLSDDQAMAIVTIGWFRKRQAFIREVPKDNWHYRFLFPHAIKVRPWVYVETGDKVSASITKKLDKVLYLPRALKEMRAVIEQERIAKRRLGLVWKSVDKHGIPKAQVKRLKEAK